MAGVSPEKLIERLASGKPVAAVVLLGTDHYLREMCRNKIIEACVPESARDWAVARLIRARRRMGRNHRARTDAADARAAPGADRRRGRVR